MEFYDFPETVGNGMSSSQLLLTPSFFRGVGEKPPTRKPFGGIQWYLTDDKPNIARKLVVGNPYEISWL